MFIACRSAVKAQRAIAQIQAATQNPRIEAIPLDLASLDSVRACAAQFRARQLPLDILVQNAGIFRGHGTTAERFEMIWGTNYLGHFLLTDQLRDRLTPTSRILAIASNVAYHPRQLDWATFTQPTPWNFIHLYGLSKLSLLLFVRELDRRLHQAQDTATLTVNALHPGFVRSNITLGHQIASLLGIGVHPDEAARSAVTILTDAAWQTTSGTFVDRHLQPLPWPTLATDPENAVELWQRSQVWTGCQSTPDLAIEATTHPATNPVTNPATSPKTDRQPAKLSPQNSTTSTTTRERGDRELLGPYRLSLSRDTMQAIAQTIQQDILPKPPAKRVLLQLLRFLVQLKFGSCFLLCVQVWKGQFYMERHLDSDVIQRLCDDPELLHCLREQLGGDLTLWRSEIWVNYPAQQLIPFWHRDVYPNLLSGSGKSMNAYIALTDVTPTNGFEYIPQTNLNETNHGVKLSDPFSGNNLFELDPELEQTAIATDLQAGEFVLFTDQLIHRSLCNTSGRIRLSIVLRITQTSLQASGYTSASGSSSIRLPINPTLATLQELPTR
ncbi:MAG: SDR family NAD(P)-dependent oxidoreductase [Oscillatoriales cyanobacterium]|nr:MAG: SDR family NAD(P)-dependent oxidoreductase [Oscillatoriales cyanobacterium]